MQEIQVTELAALAASRPTTLLLDVREPWEVSLAAIKLPGVASLTIPMNDLPQRLDLLPRDQTMVCICHHGIRSAQVARYLSQAGFEDVMNLNGGIDAWSVLVEPSVPRY